MLDFDGYAGPYLQYAYVRAARILEKAESPATEASPSVLQPVECTLLQTMSDFPNQVGRAAEQRAPVIVANYVYDLAKQFSDFYQSCRVLQEPDPEVRQFRLALVACVKQVLGNGLSLLGLSLPESM